MHVWHGLSHPDFWKKRLSRQFSGRYSHLNWCMQLSWYDCHLVNTIKNNYLSIFQHSCFTPEVTLQKPVLSFFGRTPWSPPTNCNDNCPPTNCNDCALEIPAFIHTSSPACTPEDILLRRISRFFRRFSRALATQQNSGSSDAKHDWSWALKLEVREI